MNVISFRQKPWQRPPRSRRSLWVEIATVAVLLILLVGLNYAGFYDTTTEPTSKSGGQYKAIDGDSFYIGTKEIRLQGIDAPELQQSCTDENQAKYPCGKLAKDALSALLKNKVIKCKWNELDRYGRSASFCRDGESDINGEMVRKGWAVAYRKYSNAYVQLEREAKAAQRGIWQGQFEMPSDYRARRRGSRSDASSAEEADD